MNSNTEKIKIDLDHNNQDLFIGSEYSTEKLELQINDIELVFPNIESMEDFISDLECLLDDWRMEFDEIEEEEISPDKKIPLVLDINNRKHIIRDIQAYTDKEFDAYYKQHHIVINLEENSANSIEWDIHCAGFDGGIAYDGYLNAEPDYYPNIEDAIKKCLTDSLLVLPPKENKS